MKNADCGQAETISLGSAHSAGHYMYDAKKDGKRKVWSCYGDSAEEAEENAKTVCNLLGALYLGNMAGGTECRL